LNDEDRRKLERLYVLHMREVDDAAWPNRVVLVVNLDRHGHISGEIQPGVKRPK
jgi:hypothetical protein